jgi:hypothetical protein
MNQPYREMAVASAELVPVRAAAAPGVEPLTVGELALWDAVLVALAGCPNCTQVSHATAWGDRIVAARRERFGVR